MIIDEQTVITGSFNFTRSAEEKNAENLLIIRDAALAAKYLGNWREHTSHSETYASRRGGGSMAAGKNTGKHNNLLDKGLRVLENQLGRVRRLP